MATADTQPIEDTTSDAELYLSAEILTDYTHSLFIVGKTGAGKSTLCNFLLQEKKFKATIGLKSVTQTANQAIAETNGEKLLLVDCPGFCDSSRNPSEIFSELCKAAYFAKDGPDAICFVVNLAERLDPNQYKAIFSTLTNFGNIWPHTFIVFTKEDEVMEESGFSSGKEFITDLLKNADCPLILRELMDKVSNRYICIESKNRFSDRNYWDFMCSSVLNLIREIKISNNGQRCQATIFQKAKIHYESLKENRRKYSKINNELIAEKSKLKRYLELEAGQTNTSNKTRKSDIKGYDNEILKLTENISRLIKEKVKLIQNTTEKVLNYKKVLLGLLLGVAIVGGAAAIGATILASGAFLIFFGIEAAAGVAVASGIVGVASGVVGVAGSVIASAFLGIRKFIFTN